MIFQFYYIEENARSEFKTRVDNVAPLSYSGRLFFNRIKRDDVIIDITIGTR